MSMQQQIVKIHGEYDDVHRSVNFSHQRPIGYMDFLSIYAADDEIMNVSEYKRIIVNFANLGPTNTIRVIIYANVLKDPSLNSINMRDGWFNTRNISYQGLFTSAGYDHNQEFEIPPNTTTTFHQHLYGIQYMIFAALSSGSAPASTLSIVGQAAN